MKLRDIDLNLLVSLDALLREQNVTRAARKLGLSQPALSAQLQRLRQCFNDPLLIASPQGMTPTPRASELAAPLALLLSEMEVFLQDSTAFEPATSRATFKVAMPDATQLILGRPLIGQVRRQAPHVRLALRRATPAQLASMLQDGQLDVALASSISLQSHLRSRVLMHERFVCMVRRDHPAARRPLDLDAFCALDHLLVSTSGGGFVGHVDEILEGFGRSRRVAISVEDFLVAMAVLEETDLIATLPAGLGRYAAPSLRVLQPPIDIAGFALHMAWHPRSHVDAGHRWLRGELSAAAKQLRGEVSRPKSLALEPTMDGLAKTKS